MLVSKITPSEIVGVTSKDKDWLIMAETVSKAVERYVRYQGELEKIVEMENVGVLDAISNRDDIIKNKMLNENILNNATVVNGVYDKAKDGDLDTYDDILGAGGELLLELSESTSNVYFLYKWSARSTYQTTTSLQISLDGSTWTTIQSVVAGTTSGNPTTAVAQCLDKSKFITEQFKYVRLKLTSGRSSDLQELKLYLLLVVPEAVDDYIQSGQILADLQPDEYVHQWWPATKDNEVIMRLSMINKVLYLHNAVYSVWDGMQWVDEDTAYKVFDQDTELSIKTMSWDRSHSRYGNKLAEHVIESTPASGDYKIQNYGKDIAVIIKGTDYRYRIYDISHVNALPSVITVQR